LKQKKPGKTWGDHKQDLLTTLGTLKIERRKNGEKVNAKMINIHSIKTWKKACKTVWIFLNKNAGTN